jgi:uncharacterized integral membrane protein (TIGR00698 family)
MSSNVFIKQFSHGIVFTILLGTVSVFLSKVIPFVGSILIGLLIGMIINNSVKLPNKYSPGISYMSTKTLELSLLFLAVGISFKNINSIGLGSFVFLSMVILLMLLLSVYLSKKFSSFPNGNYLIGFGTAICGSSAIAAVAPVIKAEKEDIGISLAVVNLLGSMLMILMPFIFNILELPDKLSGYLIGGSLHSVGNVAGAGFAVSEETAKVAITIKLARVAMLSPALILYSILIRRNSVKNPMEHFRLPWYVWSFIIITILVSFVQIPTEVVDQSENIGKWLLTFSMVAIGLKLSIKQLYQSGKKAIRFGLMIFLIQMILLLLTVGLI